MWVRGIIKTSCGTRRCRGAQFPSFYQHGIPHFAVSTMQRLSRDGFGAECRCMSSRKRFCNKTMLGLSEIEKLLIRMATGCKNAVYFHLAQTVPKP